MSDVHKVTTRTARKQHMCEECALPIGVGVAYRYHSGVYDGHGYGYKLCVRCSTVHHLCYAFVDDVDNGPTFGNLADWLEDCGDGWEIPWAPPKSRLKADIIGAAFRAMEIWRGELDLEERIKQERADIRRRTDTILYSGGSYFAGG